MVRNQLTFLTSYNKGLLTECAHSLKKRTIDVTSRTVVENSWRPSAIRTSTELYCDTRSHVVKVRSRFQYLDCQPWLQLRNILQLANLFPSVALHNFLYASPDPVVIIIGASMAKRELFKSRMRELGHFLLLQNNEDILERVACMQVEHSMTFTSYWCASTLAYAGLLRASEFIVTSAHVKYTTGLWCEQTLQWIVSNKLKTAHKISSGEPEWWKDSTFCSSGITQ